MRHDMFIHISVNRHNFKNYVKAMASRTRISYKHSMHYLKINVTKSENNKRIVKVTINANIDLCGTRKLRRSKSSRTQQKPIFLIKR